MIGRCGRGEEKIVTGRFVVVVTFRRVSIMFCRLYLLVFLFFLIGIESIRSDNEKNDDQRNGCSSTHCSPPSCQCPISGTHPTSFNLTEIPQLILLTFVGNLNDEALDPIRSILDPIHRNPNKCPISATFFVNDNYTDYCFVQRLFDNRNEIAVSTSSNRCPLTNCYDENHWRPWIENDWQREIKQQRLNLIEQANLHHSHLKGFRVPHFQIEEFFHLSILRQYHFHYDSSMLFKASNLLWPFTMDHRWNESDCLNCDEKFVAIEGLWQFPLHQWVHPSTMKSCRTFSDTSCLPEERNETAEFFIEFLQHNFDRHVSAELGHRSPWVIELDLFWLMEKKNIRLEGLLRFIETLLNSAEHQDVYFVSIGQALEWMKYPRRVVELNDFWAFQCRETLYEYDIDCSKAKPMTKSSGGQIERLMEENSTNETTSMPIERQAEELFRSDIVFHSIWVFVLLILSVLFYDKYFASK